MASKLRYNTLTTDVIEEMKTMRISGYSIQSLCDHYGISTATLYKWTKKNDDLKSALDEANNLSSEKVILSAHQALIEKLKTRTIVTETITNTWKDANQKIVKTQVTKKEKVVEPSAQLVTFTLERLLPKVWDTLAVKRIDQGAEDSNDYGDLIDKILSNAKEGKLKP